MTEQVILSATSIQLLVNHQGQLIGKHLDHMGFKSVQVLPVMSGAMYYAPDLLRALGQRWSGDIRVGKHLEELQYRKAPEPILVIDTIYDTGDTARHYERMLGGPGIYLMFSFLIHKSRPFETPFQTWMGAEVPEQYVYGYGLDDERGYRRELPFIAADVDAL